MSKEFIRDAVYDCIRSKNKRRGDIVGCFVQNLRRQTDTTLSFNQVRWIIMRIIKLGKTETVIDSCMPRIVDILYNEIKNEKIVMKKPNTSTRVDGSSGKVRDITIQDVKQQMYDYIAVNALKEGGMTAKIGFYQCGSLEGRGQSYGVRCVSKMLRNNNIKYGAKLDIRKCYPSIQHDKLMAYLRKYIKNDKLLWLIETLIKHGNDTGVGIVIGSYLSQFLCNLYLSQLYHEIHSMHRIRNSRRNQRQEKIKLVKYTVFYMDDILMLGTNKKDMQKAVSLLIEKAKELGLEIKPNWLFFKLKKNKKGKFRIDDGHIFVDFMGVKMYRKHLTIRKRTFLRIRRVFVRVWRRIRKHRLIGLSLSRKAISYHGIFLGTDSRRIMRKLKVKRIFEICKKVVRLHDMCESEIHGQTGRRGRKRIQRARKDLYLSLSQREGGRRSF